MGVELRMEVGPGLFTSKPMLILFRFPGPRRIAGQLTGYSARTSWGNISLALHHHDLSATDLGICFHQHVDAVQALRDSHVDPALCVHYPGSRTTEGSGYPGPLISKPSPLGSSKGAEN